jgi:hypothetical protein
VGKPESISSKISNKTRVFTLSTYLQYSAKIFRTTKERKKGHTNMKGKNNQIIPV